MTLDRLKCEQINLKIDKPSYDNSETSTQFTNNQIKGSIMDSFNKENKSRKRKSSFVNEKSEFAMSKKRVNTNTTSETKNLQKENHHKKKSDTEFKKNTFNTKLLENFIAKPSIKNSKTENEKIQINFSVNLD